jgi:DNA repair protein RadA/Sms
MSKVKTAFFCQNCGTQYSKWQGQCNACKEWNTIVEELVQKEEKVAWKTTTELKKAATNLYLLKK